MKHTYQSITAAAIEAIEAMAREQRDKVICDAALLQPLAAEVYWSWKCLVGAAARDEDSERMKRVIRAIPGPLSRVFVASTPTKTDGKISSPTFTISKIDDRQ